MKDHFELTSRTNLLRQAVMDLAVNHYQHTLLQLVQMELEKGRSIERLAKFGMRRFGLSYEQAVVGIFYLCPEYMQ